MLSFGRTRTNVGVDLYNALNANPVTTYNQTFGPRWLTPTQIMPARFAKFSVQVWTWWNRVAPVDGLRYRTEVWNG